MAHLRVADFGDQHLTDCWLNVYNGGSTTDVGVVPAGRRELWPRRSVRLIRRTATGCVGRRRCPPAPVALPRLVRRPVRRREPGRCVCGAHRYTPGRRPGSGWNAQRSVHRAS